MVGPNDIEKANKIVKLVTHRLAKKQVKFGVKVPSSVDKALKLDKENGNTLWSGAII